jgi:putative nucleotidyltransferase-like protein
VERAPAIRDVRGYNHRVGPTPRPLPPTGDAFRVPSDPPGPDAGTTSAILDLLRGQVPPDETSPETAYGSLRQLECGGYLRDLWKRAGRLDALPRGWADALERAHRKTAVDTLAALGDFRVFGRLLQAERIPFVLLKGSAYLFDLYDDPGQRPLTDIDLLVRPSDAVRLHQRLREDGYDTVQWDEEYRKFEVIAPGTHRCSFEVHWRLGMPEFAIVQEEILERAPGIVLEEVHCRRLDREDALLYHVAHQADHFFGPSLKWAIDLRLMCERWPLNMGTLVTRATGWHLRTALALAMRYFDKLFPGEAPAHLRQSLGLSPLRRWLIRPYLDSGPLHLMKVGNMRLSRYVARCLLLDRPADVIVGMGRAIKRPFVRRLGLGRNKGAPPPLWR